MLQCAKRMFEKSKHLLRSLLVDEMLFGDIFGLSFFIITVHAKENTNELLQIKGPCKSIGTSKCSLYLSSGQCRGAAYSSIALFP